jgi:hypothetical protein
MSKSFAKFSAAVLPGAVLEIILFLLSDVFPSLDYTDLLLSLESFADPACSLVSVTLSKLTFLVEI